MTSPYFLKLLPICTGGRSHFSLNCDFSLNLRASLALHIIGTSSGFVKKRLELRFTDGNIWPSKISNGPPKNLKWAKHTVYRRKGAYRFKTAVPEPYLLQKRSLSAKNKLSDRQ